MARKPDNDELPDEIPLDLTGPVADNDGPTGDVAYLNMPWAKASASIQAKTLQAMDINTYDGGRLVNVDDILFVLNSGDHNDADVVRQHYRR